MVWWNTCGLEHLHVFFQFLLLLGYTYSHLLIKWIRSRQQCVIHLILLSTSLLMMVGHGFSWGSPILPDKSWKPSDSNYPILKIVQLLTFSVGLPFFVLSTTGPLIQGWLSRTRSRISPYRFYALSNLGSLLALVTYPFVIEPFFTLKIQAQIWFYAYLCFTFLCAILAIHASRVPTNDVLEENNAGVLLEKDPIQKSFSSPTWKNHALWFGLSTCSSVMLLAVTNQMCQEVAVVPFLWVLPLSLYLLSFILCFQSDRVYRRSLFLPLFGIAIWIGCIVLHLGIDIGLLWQIGSFSFLLLASCMVCHGELVLSKPPAAYLTNFYLMLAMGGVAGGIFAGIMAPYLFQGLWEVHLGIFGTCGVLLPALLHDLKSWLYQRSPWPAGLTLLAMSILTKFAFDEIYPESITELFQPWRRNDCLLWKTRRSHPIL